MYPTLNMKKSCVGTPICTDIAPKANPNPNFFDVSNPMYMLDKYYKP